MEDIDLFGFHAINWFGNFFLKYLICSCEQKIIFPSKAKLRQVENIEQIFTGLEYLLLLHSNLQIIEL